MLEHIIESKSSDDFSKQIDKIVCATSANMAASITSSKKILKKQADKVKDYEYDKIHKSHLMNVHYLNTKMYEHARALNVLGEALELVN